MSMPAFAFFFQAEDGIRGGHVTGVQTCALPICPRPHPCMHRNRAAITQRPHRRQKTKSATRRWRIRIERRRSEERRVGKECRCGGRTKTQRERGEERSCEERAS